MKPEHNILIKKTGIIDSCNSFGKFNCSITDCFSCPNADYKILDLKGKVRKDYTNQLKKALYYHKYLITFYDNPNFEKIEEYLKDENSDYEIIDFHRHIMRLSKRK